MILEPKFGKIFHGRRRQISAAMAKKTQEDKIKEKYKIIEGGIVDAVETTLIEKPLKKKPTLEFVKCRGCGKEFKFFGFAKHKTACRGMG